jgi:hypothetical protein
MDSETPRTKEEREVAAVMELLWHMVKQIGEAYPSIPKTAISAGLINVGAQMGMAHVPVDVLANYFVDVSLRIVAGQVTPFLGGGEDGKRH